MGDQKKTVDFQDDEPTGNTSKYGSRKIVDLAQRIKPHKIHDLGAAYDAIGDTFGGSLKVFRNMAQRLEQAWTGADASVEASRQLALLYVAAMVMQINAKQIGGVLKNLASDKPDFRKTTFLYDGAYGIPATSSVETNPGNNSADVGMSLAQFKRAVTANGDYFHGKFVDPASEGLTVSQDAVFAYDPAKDQRVMVTRNSTTEQRDAYARYLLLQGNNGIFSTWQGIPQSVTLDLPPALSDTSDKPHHDNPGNQHHGPPDEPGPAGTPTRPGDNMPNRLDTGPTNPARPAGLPDPYTGGGTDLSGLDNPSLTDPGGTNLNSPPHLGDGGTSFTNPSTGTGLARSYQVPSIGGGGLNSGSNPLGLRTGTGSDATAGARGAVNTAAAAAEEAAGTTAANAARAGGYAPMMPPMAGGQQGQNQDRERSAWLTENEEFWGPDDDVAPPLIG